MTEQKVTAGPWQCTKSPKGSRLYVMSSTDEFLFSIASGGKTEVDVRFAVAAVNACFAINPEHPERVAEKIEEAFAIAHDVATSSLDSGQDSENMFARARALLSDVTDKGR